MYKLTAIFVLLLLGLGSVSAQTVPAGFDISNYGVRIEPDKRLIVVLAAIEAGRTTGPNGEPVPVFSPPLSAEGKKFRELLTSDLAQLNPELRQRISSFLVQHKRRNAGKTDSEIIAPFISMAYALTPAPELADPVVTSDLPGALLDVLDFAPLVRDFYRRSSISANLDEYVKAYRKVADGRLRESSQEMISDLLSYLHTRPQLYYAERTKVQAQRSGSKRTSISRVETRERERRFFIVPEMLAPAGSVNFVNIRDDYYAVVPPDSDLGFSEVRRAYLQFVIDPIVLAHSADIATVRDSVRKILDERRKADPSVSPDVYLAISRSLVAAIDARQDEFIRKKIVTEQARRRIDQAKDEAEKRAISAELEKLRSSLTDETALELSEDYERGAILAFYFAEQLKGVEESGFDIAASMREMILSIDPAKETGRLAQNAEARRRGLAGREERRRSGTASIIVENPVTTRLLEIQKLIDAKNYSRAGADLRRLQEEYPAETRVLYNLGRVASLSAEAMSESEPQKAKLLEAKTAYEKVVLNEKNDKALLSLSYVALAKIYEFYGESEYAVQIYDAAIRVGDVPGGAYRQALDAKARLLKDQ
jgi:tetratricopeptide (TPR) repeat protein